MSLILDIEHRLPSEINSENPHESCNYLHNMKYELNIPLEEVVYYRRIKGKFPKGIDLTDDTSGIIKGNLVPLDTYHEVKDYVLKKLKDLSDDAVPYPNCYKTLDYNNLEPLTVKDILEAKEPHYSGRTWGVKGHLAYARDYPGGDLTKFYFELGLGTVVKNVNIQVGSSKNEMKMTLPYGSDVILITIEENATCDKVYNVSIKSDEDFTPILLDPRDPEYKEYKPIEEISLSIMVKSLDKEGCVPMEEAGVSDVYIIQKREYYIQAVAPWYPEVFVSSYGDSNKNLKNDKGELLSGPEYVEWRKSQGHKYPAKC